MKGRRAFPFRSRTPIPPPRHKRNDKIWVYTIFNPSPLALELWRLVDGARMDGTIVVCSKNISDAELAT